jgi:23S rRNA (guanosine2251-2'-O)-methyltransferase
MNRPAHMIFGVRPVLDLLRSGEAIERVHLARGRHGPRLREIEAEARRLGVPVRLDERPVLDRMAGSDRHQGVIAVGGTVHYADRVEVLGAVTPPAFLLVLDGVEDPGNLGAILRTAAATGVQGVFIPERRAVGVTPAVVKSSAGYARLVPIVRENNLSELIATLKDNGIWVVAVEQGAPAPWSGFDLTLPLALVMGGEGGIRPLLRSRCEAAVGLPMAGGVESLNVSAAFAAVAFEVVRARRGGVGVDGPGAV